MSTPSEALEKPQPQASTAIEQARNTVTAIQSATILNRSELTFFADMIEAADLIPFDKNVPKAVQKYRVMAKIVGGAAHGFDPISSQENLHVIQGRCVLSARGMAIKLRRTGKYDTRVEKLDENECRIAVLEKNDAGKWMLKGHVEFNKTHAEKAGLLESNKTMYGKWGPDMLYANGMKRVVRRFAPEVLDTNPIDYRLSKESAAAQIQQSDPVPVPQQIAAPVVEEAAPVVEQAVGSEYVEREYQEPVETEAAEVIADTVEGEFAEAEPGQEYTGAEADHVAPEVIAAEPEDTDAAADASAIEAEPIDEDESKLADLRIAVKEALVEKVGSLKGDQKVFLKGREIDNEDAITLGAMLADLNAM